MISSLNILSIVLQQQRPPVVTRCHRIHAGRVFLFDLLMWNSLFVRFQLTEVQSRFATSNWSGTAAAAAATNGITHKRRLFVLCPYLRSTWAELMLGFKWISSVYCVKAALGCWLKSDKLFVCCLQLPLLQMLCTDAVMFWLLSADLEVYLEYLEKARVPWLYSVLITWLPVFLIYFVASVERTRTVKALSPSDLYI